MPSIRFRLEKPTLTGLAARVAAQYGPDARIVDTEESVVGGIAGLFGRRVVDVTVELPDRAAPDGAHEFSMRTRVGLAALLDDADSMDVAPASAHGDDPWAVRPPVEGVSTQGGDFASMLDALRIDVEPADTAGGTPARPLRPAAPPVRMHAEPVVRPAAFSGGAAAVRRAAAPAASAAPEVRPVEPVLHPMRALERGLAAPPPTRTPPPRPAPLDDQTPEELAAARQFVWATPTPRSRMGRTAPGAPPPQRTRPGDLLLLVGLGEDPMRVAKSLRDRMQKGYVCDGGTIEGNTRRRVDDRRGAVAARAYGVRSDQPVIVAYGVGGAGLAEEDLDGLLSIDSDQAWLVVDAAREPEETLEWTGRLRGRLQVDAVASVRATRGRTLEALAAIGLPEAWRELERA